MNIERTWVEGQEFDDVAERKLAERFFNAELAREILETITDDDCKILGINTRQTRPEYFITTVLLVPPPAIRPAIMITEVKF